MMDKAKKLPCTKGSVTVEACFSVPMFFLVMISLCYLLSIMGNQQIILGEMVKAAKQYSAFEVQTPAITEKNGNIHGLDWNVTEGKGNCICQCQYKIPAFSKWFRITMKQQIPVCAYYGKSMVEDQLEGEDIYVYLAKNGTVYHKEITCPYLKLGIREVSFDEIAKQRNRSGGIYRKCEICIYQENLQSKDVVWITPYGVSYHGKRSCHGLKRTVQQIKLSQVGKLPPCSKCTKTKS